ncbi:Subtilase family protein [Raphanus sativus]|nr:Subtilase family protein [Raphanus sativus]
MWLVFWTLILIAKFVLAGAYEDKTEVHIAYLGARKHNDVKLTTASHIDLLKSLLGSKKDARESMIYSYKHGFSGFAAHLTSSQAKKLSEHPDVVQVTRDSYYEPQTTRTYDFLGLSQSNPEGLLLQARMGEDIIIGFVDSGVWPESESFNDRGLGPIPERWKGKCMDGQDFDSKKHCNRKLIGARYYLKKKRTSGTDYMSARESVAHGTHVASIAGGSLVPNVSDKGLGVGTVRGGAPSARIAVYKACWKGEEEKSCEYSDILKAMDDAIYDGVDVLSISLASAIPILTETNRLDEISYGAFHAISKGIPVICAGGNSGPGAYTVFNIAPWIITVAATTLDRWFPTPLTLGNNVTLLARTAFKGREIQGGLIYVENAKEITSALKGKVVLVFVTADGGDSGPEFIEASTDAELKALIIADKIQDFNVIVTDIPPILINIDYEQGTTMMKYIGSTRAT